MESTMMLSPSSEQTEEETSWGGMGSKHLLQRKIINSFSVSGSSPDMSVSWAAVQYPPTLG